MVLCKQKTQGRLGPRGHPTLGFPVMKGHALVFLNYGFFDDRHEQDYERFQTVFPHAAWFSQDDDLTLFTIKEMVEEINNG